MKKHRIRLAPMIEEALSYLWHPESRHPESQNLKNNDDNQQYSCCAIEHAINQNYPRFYTKKKDIPDVMTSVFGLVDWSPWRCFDSGAKNSKEAQEQRFMWLLSCLEFARMHDVRITIYIQGPTSE